MGTDRLSDKLYIARSSQIAARRLGDEMMIMSGRDSTLFTLNPLATVIWEAANGWTSLDEIVERDIRPAYDVERDTALRDAESMAYALAEHGILLVSSQPIHNSATGLETR